ncbi:MAG: HD domain-containing phosphohydrolase [Solirubrobacteraceae bacterium]
MRQPASSAVLRAPTVVQPGIKAVPWPVLVLLAGLSAWAIGYELGCTLLPAFGNSFLFAGIAPDIPFALGGMLLIHRGIRGERGWLMIGIGALCWAAGDVYWQVKLSTMSSPPVPSLADAGYLSLCPLWFAGILSLVRRRTHGVSQTVIADAMAAALAVGAVCAAVVIHPVLANATGSTLSISTNLAYPLCDMALIGLIAAATALANWRLDRTWGLLAAAVVVFWIADSMYLVTVATNTYSNHEWFNPLWYCSPVIAAWAAWLPNTTPSVTARQSSVRGIMLPLAFACGALAVLVWSEFDPAGVIAIVLATSSLLLIMCRLALTWRDNAVLLRASQDQALTDPLTGLANRRALAEALEQRIPKASAETQLLLIMFDLDGFKAYNDNYGHPAGDALLQRFGKKLAAHLVGRGTAYRMGGDEFCALIDAVDDPFRASVQAADELSEQGDGFSIGCSYGSILLPSEAQDIKNALRIADERMYAHKRSGRLSASRQSKDVLLRALVERSSDLGAHLRSVAEMAVIVARTFSLTLEDVEQIRHAAELHDVGKVAIPDAILDKPAALDESEREFMQTHTLIGERIIAEAPALKRVAALVRSSHENFDGTGYPDRLAGQEIPLGSRIITACDALHAMTTDRPYRKAIDQQSAIAELHRCAGTQFDPLVVERLCQTLTAENTALSRVA